VTPESSTKRRTSIKIARVSHIVPPFIVPSLLATTFLDSKLESSTAANEVLGNQLQNMEPMLASLEQSLESNKAKLKGESELRQELESRWLGHETHQALLREENAALRQECEALGEHLTRSMIQQKTANESPNKPIERDLSRHSRSVATSGGDTDTQTATSTVDDSYGEILGELEGVTEQLIATQQKLWKAEDDCRESKSRVTVLERALKSLRRLDQELGVEAQKSLMDDMEDEESNVSEHVEEPKVPNSQELERLRSELEEAKRDKQAAEMQAQYAQQEARIARANTKNADIRAQSAEIEELKAQNAVLMEETNHLHDVLAGRNDREPDDSRTNRQSKEAAYLHRKLKDVIKENVSLRQHVERLQKGQTPSRNDEVLELKKQVAKLEFSLQKAEEENLSAIRSSDFEWYVKLEKLRKDLDDQKAEEVARLQSDLARDNDAFINTLRGQVDRLVEDNHDLQDIVDQLEREVRRYQKENSTFADQARQGAENLKLAKDEITALRKEATSLATDLERAERYVASTEEQAKEARNQYADACAELEVARQILDEAGLEHETIVRENERELKSQTLSLSKELDRFKRDYAELENELLETQHRYCESQEEASRKTADEVDYLTGKIAEMEAALELARADYSDLSIKLEKARKESHSFLRQGEKQSRENAPKSLQSYSSSTSEVSKALSDDESEDGDLKKKFGDLVTQLEKVNAELRSCRGELELLSRENQHLKDDVARLEESGDRGAQVLDKLFNGDDLPNRAVRSPLDPEQQIDRVEEAPAPPTIERAPESLFKLPFSSWFSRDPPTEANAERSDNSPESNHTSRDMPVDLQSQLHLVTRENEFLKEKIILIESSRLNETKSSSEPVATEPSEVRQMIKDLQESLQLNEKNVDELDRLSQKLLSTERKLVSTQVALEETNDQNDDLRAEVRELKAAVMDTRQKLQEAVAVEQGVQFGDLRDQLHALADEKSALQQKLDETKIALSTAEYDLASSKEEISAKDTAISKSKGEITTLADELDRMGRNLHDIKAAYEEVLDQLRLGREKENGTSNHIRQLSEQNESLLRVVDELQDALAVARDAEHRVTEKASLDGDQRLMLIDEVSKLSDALLEARQEYHAVVEELEAVCDLFEDAREEAERNGKEAAIREIRTAMKGSRERDRQVIRQQATKIFEENAALQQKLSEVEMALSQARQFQKRSEEVAAMRTEVQILRETLEAEEDEIKSLKERELTLDLALAESRNELKHTRAELEIIKGRSPTDQSMERSAGAQSVEELRPTGNSTEFNALRERLQVMLECAENELLYPRSIDSQYESRNEGLRLKFELLDLSTALEKIMRENTVIEEELEYMRRVAESARKDGETEGRQRGMNEVRTEANRQRQHETKEFKEKCNALISENSTLMRKLRENEVQLSLAVMSKEESSHEVARLEEELQIATMKLAGLQQEVLDLTMELATREEKGINYVKPSRDSSGTAMENVKLQTKLRYTEGLLERTKQSDERCKQEIVKLSNSLNESEQKVEELKRICAEANAKLATMKSSKDALVSEKHALQTRVLKAETTTSQTSMANLKELEEFQYAFQLSKEENAKLRSQTALLKETLEASRRELDGLRTQFDRVYKDKSFRDNGEVAVLREQLKSLVSEKAALQKQVDESKVNLTLQKYTQDRNLEELKVYQDKLLTTQKAATNAQYIDQSKAEEEIAQSREDAKAAMRVLRQTSHCLDLVEGLESSSLEIDETLVGRAEDIKKRVSEVTALLAKARGECSTVNDQIFRLSNELKAQERKAAAGETALERLRQAQLRDKVELELNEVKCADAKKEAAGYKSEIHRLRSALENAHKEHSSLRGQLEQMNFRVQQMCMEAEAKGKAAATEALRAGMGNAADSDRRELMTQFKKFYDENVSLQIQLDRHKIMVANLEREVQESSDKTATLESANKRLTEELDSLRDDLDQAKAHRTKVVQELAAVKDRVSEMSDERKMKEEKPETDSGESLISMQPFPVEKKAAILPGFHEQFSKMVRPNLVVDVQEEDKKPVVSTTNEMLLESPRTNTRKMQLIELQRQVQMAIEESSQRTDEIRYSNPTSVGGGRPPIDIETAFNRRGRSASPAKRENRIHGLSSEILFSSQRSFPRTSMHTDYAVVGSEPRRYEVLMDEDSSIHSSADQVNSESREESHESPMTKGLAMPTTTTTPPSPRPLLLPRSVPGKESKNLTSRALEAIAQSKQNKYRYRNLLSGKDRSEVQPPSPSAVEDRGRE